MSKMRDCFKRLSWSRTHDPPEDKYGSNYNGDANEMPDTRPLSTRREVIEQLDCDVIFDYLIQNGVLEKAFVEELRAEKSKAKVNIAVLQTIENGGDMAYKLFINALRTMGQHQLANQLDEGERIRPKSGSGYLGTKRKRGQVGVQIKVTAIKLQKDDSTENAWAKSREWITQSEEDVKIIQPRPIAQIEPRRRSMENLEILDIEEPQKENESCCHCLCFSCLFGGHKKEQKYKERDISTSNGARNVHSNRPGTSNNSKYTSKEHIENNRNAFGLLEYTAEKFYDILNNTGTPCHIAMLKYFEQKREILVLGTFLTDTSIMVNLCMKKSQVEELSSDYNSGKLTKDLESVILTEETLKKLELSAMKIRTEIDIDELNLAEVELK
ncbi:unnamed protein product [Owenia fusiformis]|uniref:Uncharacterized protein n=1 Tax=Owenia fusiformis TaxID=6347 RepID=A0A8J1Y0Z2_OWEFU|nr:unnamed protein product [Owenia fusiformis]